jgi:tetratricopeptide (TPR) repeat protein
MRYLTLAVVAFTLASCSRDPNYLKKKDLERGNKYMAAGKTREAEIMYKNAIKEDRKYAEAYYRLALAYLKDNSGVNAVRPLRVAAEELKKGTPESNDAILKLAEIEVSAAATIEKSDAFIKEVEGYRDGLLKRNPNSWEGHKLSGDLELLQVKRQLMEGHGPEAKKLLSAAIGEFRTALQGNPGDYQVTLALARVLQADGEIAEAEAMFKGLTDKEKTNLLAYRDLYRLYLAERKLPDAEALLKRSIKNNPTDTTMRLEMARFYLLTNRRPELIALLTQMKSDLKDFPQAYIQSGDFFMNVGQFDEAVKQFEEGIAKDPKNKVDYLRHEVETYIHANNLQLATAKNDEILKIDSKNPEARGLKATLMLDKGEYATALTELQSVVTARPQNYVAHFNLGRAHLGNNQIEQARQEFDKAVELRPDYVVARLAQTQVALTRGDTEGALHDADELLRYVPNSVEGKVMKAAALQRLQRYDEARNLMQQGLEKDPKAVPLMLELGVLDLEQKKNKDAIEIFRRAYETNNTNVRALLGESRAYLADGQIDKSVQIIADELKAHPDRLDLEGELGAAQTTAGQFPAAIGTFQDLLTKVKDPRQQATLWIDIGQAYRYAGDIQKSILAFENSRKGNQDTAAIVRDLGMLYEEVGRKDTAKKYYEQALKLDPTDAYALNNLAYFIAENNGDLNEALGYAQRAKQKLPSFSEITDTLGWIYLKKNLTDNAVDSFRSLVVQAPTNPIYHYHYAMALNAKGDRESARKECMTALADKPNKAQADDIKKLLSRIS